MHVGSICLLPLPRAAGLPRRLRAPAGGRDHVGGQLVCMLVCMLVALLPVHLLLATLLLELSRLLLLRLQRQRERKVRIHLLAPASPRAPSARVRPRIADWWRSAPPPRPSAPRRGIPRGGETAAPPPRRRAAASAASAASSARATPAASAASAAPPPAGRARAEVDDSVVVTQDGVPIDLIELLPYKVPLVQVAHVGREEVDLALSLVRLEK